MPYKVHIKCSVCNDICTRLFKKKDIDVYYCKMCKVKRRLRYVNRKEAVGEVYDVYPNKKPSGFQKKTIEPQTNTTTTVFEEPKLDTLETWFETQEPLKDVPTKEDTRFKVHHTEPSKQLPQQSFESLPKDNQLLGNEHIKTIARFPFTFVSMLTKYDGFNLTEKEATELSSNPIVQRVINKNIGKYVDKYPDEYVCLGLFAITFLSKGQGYLKFRKEELIKHGTIENNKNEGRNATGTTESGGQSPPT